MPTIVFGASLLGVQAVPVQVEVDLLRRLPAIVIVGLASAAVRESAERVRSALIAAGVDFPRQRVVVSLAPSDLRKEGAAFDLPIAIGIAASMGLADPALVDKLLFVGELGLAGDLRPSRGAVAYACMAKELGLTGVVLPRAMAPEAALVEGLAVHPAESLADVLEFLARQRELPMDVAPPAPPTGAGPDLADVRGQGVARFALEVAAAGGHNLLLEGPPGCGKTMLAARLPGILPEMTRQEALECTRIHSVAGLHDSTLGFVGQRPFRAPHHSVSPAGLVGSASLRPGEASLAHNGVLFLDEFPEFPRAAREVLRGPLEDRRIVLARAHGTVVLPAAFMLVAAANPCPCGHLGHPTRPCTCGASERERYRQRLAGPLVDRIDLRVELTPVGASELLAEEPSEPTLAVRRRVEAARARQRARYGGSITCNAELPPELVNVHVGATPEARAVLRRHIDGGRISARVARRLLKVARTVADLEGEPRVEVPHVLQAAALRHEAAGPGDP